MSQPAFAQTEKQNKDAFNLIDSILQKDKASLEILEVYFPPELQAILLRFQQALAKDPAWTENYFAKNMKPGQPLPYHEKFGVSRDEYQKIIDFGNGNKKMVVKDSAHIKIVRTGNLISFSTEKEDISFLELLKIDTKSQMIIFDKDTIPFDSEINAPPTTPFGEWHGYSWKKEISNMREDTEIKLSTLKGSILKINFGRTIDSKKNIFRLEYNEVSNGQVKSSYSLSCFLY